MRSKKYDQMHREILDLCRQEHILVYAGKTPCIEYFLKKDISSAKQFFVDQKHFGKLADALAELDKSIYQVKRTKVRGYGSITVQRKDILATSYPQIMRYPKGSYHPTFLFREWKEEDAHYSVMVANQQCMVPKPLIDDCEEKPYRGSFLQIPTRLNAYYKCLYKKEITENHQENSYPVFAENITLEALVKEATERGFLTEKNQTRYAEYRAWMKSEKNPVTRAYKQYQTELMTMTLPKEE